MTRPVTEAIETFVSALKDAGCVTDNLQIVFPMDILLKLYEEHKGQFKRVFYSNQDDKSFMRLKQGVLELGDPS